MYRYKAFGFVIESDIEIAQIPSAHEKAPVDVRIREANLRERGIPKDHSFYSKKEMYFCPKQLAIFRITNGNLIEYELLLEKELSHLGVYLMGSCMGAIIHQRDLMPMHGSCVTDGIHSVLITGDSGAGKSTMASEFLNNGWKLLTDDVAVMKDIEGKILVQSSYPSQKLWKDSLSKYGREDERVHTLYSRGNEDKYGINVADMFCDGCRPLSLIIRLIAAEECETGVYPVEGFAKVDQVRRNTYRSYMISEEDRQRHFQRCVTIGSKIPMAVVLRKIGDQTAHELYSKIIEFLKDC